MKFSLPPLVLIASLLCALPAVGAGDWGSSGSGEFLRDQHNPWFLKNMAEVKYCIQIDPIGFSASAEKAQEITTQALDYWKAQLASRASELGVGTQKFVLTPSGCSGKEELTLQFGYGTLSENQRKLFSDNGEDPLDYVGIAIRTEYDKETLKGKGFVFVSSDQGDNPYNRGNGVTRKLWSYDGLLFRILQHELGHVFGIAHTDEGFMAADFPENMVRNYRPFRTVRNVPFFEPLSKFESCGFSLTNTAGCVLGETNDQWMSFRLTRKDDQLREELIGTVTDAKRSSSRLKFPLKVFLPKEQKLFSVPPGILVLKGPARQEFKVTGTMETPSGEKKPVLLDLRPDSGEAFFDDGKGFGKH